MQDNSVRNAGGMEYKTINMLIFNFMSFQLLMFILRLGAVSVLLSDTLVSGFTTGAAIQVFVSQLKDLLGIKLPDLKGYFVTIKVNTTVKSKTY